MSSQTALATEEGIRMVTCPYPRGGYIFILSVSFQIIYSLQRSSPIEGENPQQQKGKTNVGGRWNFPTWFQLFPGAQGHRHLRNGLPRLLFALFWSVWRFKWDSGAPPSSQVNSIIARVNQGKCILEHQIIPNFYLHWGYCQTHKFCTLKQKYLKLPWGFCSWKNKLCSLEMGLSCEASLRLRLGGGGGLCMSIVTRIV